MACVSYALATHQYSDLGINSVEYIYVHTNSTTKLGESELVRKTKIICTKIFVLLRSKNIYKCFRSIFSLHLRKRKRNACLIKLPNSTVQFASYVVLHGCCLYVDTIADTMTHNGRYQHIMLHESQRNIILSHVV